VGISTWIGADWRQQFFSDGLFVCMKASEVLNRYANGARDFRRVDLRGQSFRGQDLSEADFSEADIRGTNFTRATLTGANFTRARAGVQAHWIAIQLLLTFVLSVLAGVLQGYSSYWLTSNFPQVWNPAYRWHSFNIKLASTINPSC